MGNHLLLLRVTSQPSFVNAVLKSLADSLNTLRLLFTTFSSPVVHQQSLRVYTLYQISVCEMNEFRYACSSEFIQAEDSVGCHGA